MKELPESHIKKLAKILKDQDLTELEVESNGMKIKVRKEYGVISSAVTANGSAPAPAASAPSQAAAPAANDPNVVEVKSPMVGTFYASPSPDAAAFVQVGSKVKPGDTLCIVEAMKLMNELPAEVGGEVVEICVNNEESISFGQVIMKIKK